MNLIFNFYYGYIDIYDMVSKLMIIVKSIDISPGDIEYDQQ